MVRRLVAKAEEDAATGVEIGFVAAFGLAVQLRGAQEGGSGQYVFPETACCGADDAPVVVVEIGVERVPMRNEEHAEEGPHPVDEVRAHEKDQHLAQEADIVDRGEVFAPLGVFVGHQRADRRRKDFAG